MVDDFTTAGALTGWIAVGAVAATAGFDIFANGRSSRRGFLGANSGFPGAFCSEVGMSLSDTAGVERMVCSG